MAKPWLGTRTIAFIPAVVQGQNLPVPAAGWESAIERRLLFDPDPVSSFDRSVRHYIHTVSYGRASLNPVILPTVTVPWSHCGGTLDAAIEATNVSHNFENVVAVFSAGTPCPGWAFGFGSLYSFTPARANSIMRNWCYLSIEAPMSVWAHELIHVSSNFPDLYKTSPHPGAFDIMAGGWTATHPSTFTKRAIGWLDPASIVTVPDRSWQRIGHANRVVGMAALNGKLFCATNDNGLHWRDPVGTNVAWQKIGHANRVVAMTALNGKLFCATDDNGLHWRDPVGTNVAWQKIGHANGVVGMAALNGKLFCATNDNGLHWRDPVGTNVAWQKIGHANRVVAMTALDGKLFCATDDNGLHWRDPVGTNVAWQKIGHANGVVGMAALNGKLFCATNDNGLHWRDVVGVAGSYLIHPIGYLHPPPPGSMSAIRMTGSGGRYYLAEARRRVDSFDGSTTGVSTGVPSEGVVVYEIDEANWPIHLMTPTALGAGGTWSSPSADARVDVRSVGPIGYEVDVITP